MMDKEGPLIAGWYGKIPSLGDFISRRLPASFIDPWDAWLQRSMIASRAQLGDHWLNIYLMSPIWRFILMPGICGDNLCMGILMPSVDKIGRHFPLTIAIQIAPHPTALFTAFSAQTWYASLEHLALSSLNGNVSPNDLDQGLANYPFPQLPPGSRFAPIEEFSKWWQVNIQTGLVDYKTLTLPSVSLLHDKFESIAENILISAGQGKSIWWKVSQNAGDDTEATILHCFAGLPQEYRFAMLLSDTGQSL